MMLQDLLENTLNPLSQVRQHAELVIQNSVASDEFIIQLADYSFISDHPIHLRQLSLILILQQTKQRLKSFSESEREYFLKLAFFILNSSDHTLKNCGTSLLSSLFVNGSNMEQNKIATQLLTALNEDDVNAILLSVRCLCEIIEETNLTTQVKMLSVLSNRLHELTHNLPWKESNELIRFIAKIYRKIAAKASECKLADDIPPHETEILVGSFGPWIEIVVSKLSEYYQGVEEIFSNLSLLLEIIRFIAIAYEGFPYLCEENEVILSTVTGLCWKFLLCLIELKHLNSEELKEYETVSEEGDRVSVDIFVILVFELLQLCLNSNHANCYPGQHGTLINSNELTNLIRVLMRYIQLTPEQYEQAYFFGNEFIAAEEDDTLELSLRHTGKLFLKNLCQTSFKDLVEGVFQILEVDLTELNELLGDTSHLYSLNISSEWISKLEAMMFTLSAIGRPIVKKYIKSSKGDMSVSSSPAPFAKKLPSRHNMEIGETITENDLMRLNQIIMTFVNLFYQFPSNLHEFSAQELSCFTSLSVVRGAISKLLTIYCPILVKIIAFQPAISSCLKFSMLPSIRPDEQNYKMKLSETLASRLLHCRAFGEMLRITAKTYGPMTITHHSNGDNIIQIALECCVDLCSLCNDSTIHIPLEIMTNVLTIVTQSFELEFQSLVVNETGPISPTKQFSDEIIARLVRIGLTVWSIYCFDPFTLEVTKEMLSATVHVCSFRSDSLTIFLEQFIPPIEHLIGELVGNQTSKTISDHSVRLLSESVSKISLYSSYSLEASRRLSLPTIQAMIRIMHFSTDVNGIVDVGDILRSLIILFSSKYFDITIIPDDVIDDLLTETLLCIRIIFSKSMDYNYPASIGSLYQLIAHFPSQTHNYQEYIQQTINIILSLGKSNNQRNILIMGLIHIFNKNPLLIAESLGHIKLNHSDETALQFLLEVWFELHPLLESPYSLFVSTNGLIELIRMYSLQGISSGFLIRVLRLLLETLPSVIRNETQASQTNLDNHGKHDEDDYSSEGDYFFSDEEDNGDEEDGENDDILNNNEGYKGEDDSPFAPAELYLSDLIDINNSRSCGSTHVYIPNELAYSPYQNDPIYQTKILTKLAVMIANAEQQPSGILLASLNSLHANEQQLLKSLLAESPESIG